MGWGKVEFIEFANYLCSDYVCLYFGGFIICYIIFAKYILAKFKNSISEIKVANNKEGKFYYFSFSDLEMRQTCYFLKIMIVTNYLEMNLL